MKYVIDGKIYELTTIDLKKRIGRFLLSDDRVMKIKRLDDCETTELRRTRHIISHCGKFAKDPTTGQIHRLNK